MTKSRKQATAENRKQKEKQFPYPGHPVAQKQPNNEIFVLPGVIYEPTGLSTVKV